VYELDLDKHATLPIEPSTGYAMLYTVPPDPAHADDLRLQHLFDVLPQPPMRFVYLSTTGVYGNRDGAIVDEAVALAPQTDRARRRVASEHALARYCKRTGSELIVLRVPGIYGPGRLGAERLREGLPVLQESDANPGNRIHVVDLVSCCLAALSPDVPPGIYNVGDGDTRSATWFAFARQCGLPPPPIVSRTQAQQQLSAERLSFLNESRRLDLTRMVTILKPRLQYADAADGIAASL
jgi:nucleoside-diphosphate-sugar epimerase